MQRIWVQAVMTVLVLGLGWQSAPLLAKPALQPMADINLYLPWVSGTRDVDLNQTVTFPIPGLDHPNGLAIHRQRNLVFVTSRDNNQLLQIDPNSGVVQKTVPTGDQPWGVAVNEVTDRVYVSNFGGEVWIYQADTLEKIAAVDVGKQPGMLAVNETTDTVAVVITGEDKIAFLRGTTLEKSIQAGGSGAFAIVADKLNNQFVVSHRNSRNLRIYYHTNAGWRADGAEITLADRAVPFGMAYNYRTSKLYVHTWHPDGSWYVEAFRKISQAQWETGAKIQVGNSGHKNDADVGGVGIAVNVNNGHLFVTNTRQRTLTIINGPTDEIIESVTVGDDPTLVEMNRDTGTIFVGLRGGNQLHRLRDQ